MRRSESGALAEALALGTGQITITASVNGVWSEAFHSNVTVTHPAKLVLLGARAKAPGQTKVTVTVGVRNAGKGRAELPAIAPNLGAITHYINISAGAIADVRRGHCFPWGPWPEGWEWRVPNTPSNYFACASGPIDASATSWYEMVVSIDPRHPLVTGEISFSSGEKAAIVIDTRETLPVTGPAIPDIALAAIVLIVPGVLLVMANRRYRRTRRS